MNVILLKQKAGKFAKASAYIAANDSKLQDEQRENFRLNILVLRQLYGHEAIKELILPNLSILEDYLTYAMDSDFKTHVRDFCQILRGLEGKDNEECDKFRDLVAQAGLFNELKSYIDAVQRKIDEENEADRKKKEEEEAAEEGKV